MQISLSYNKEAPVYVTEGFQTSNEGSNMKDLDT